MTHNKYFFSGRLESVRKDPEGGKPSCAIQDRKTDGEAAKLDWVNKYIRNIFGEGGRRFEPAAAA